MRSLPPSNLASDERWLVDACTSELRAHRVIFLFVLCPLLGYWLPALMFNVGLSVALIARASAAQQGEVGLAWLAFSAAFGFIAPLLMLPIGAWRERHRLRKEDGSAGGGMKLPDGQGAALIDRVRSIWIGLKGRLDPPRIVCKPNFRILAHAYDDRSGQTIEVSAGLASRVVRDDPLAISILRHEVAHLVFADLPAIRRQSMAAAAAVFSLNASLVICVVAAVTIVVLTDIGKFPLPPTLWNIVAVHVVAVLATLNVTMPLLLGRYAVRRYSGFVVALAEMRADVSAGVWGDGLRAFSRQIEADPTVRAAPLNDAGLAYLSPALSHFPARERAALLGNPGRLATPKLKYFAIALASIWLLAFHQGQAVWDTLLMCAAVAFIQALTIHMLLASGPHGGPTWRRAAILACGVLVAQALPLISIEGIVYLTQHLTAAIVMPGGFGSAEDADYWRDTVETFQEFGRFAGAATGGFTFFLGIAVTTGVFWAAPRLMPLLKPATARWASLAAAATSAAASLLVSYGFFQERVYESLRVLAYKLSPYDTGASQVAPPTIVGDLRAALSKSAFTLSDALHGSPILGSAPWLRLALPDIAALILLLIAVGASWPRKTLWLLGTRRSTP